MTREKRYRLQAWLVTAALMLLMLVLINLTLHSLTATGTNRILARAPHLAAAMEAQNRLVLGLFALVSLFYLGSVMLAAILPGSRRAERRIGRRSEEDNRQGECDPIEELAAELEWAALLGGDPDPTPGRDRERRPL